MDYTTYTLDLFASTPGIFLSSFKESFVPFGETIVLPFLPEWRALVLSESIGSYISPDLSLVSSFGLGGFSFVGCLHGGGGTLHGVGCTKAGWSIMPP